MNEDWLKIAKALPIGSNVRIPCCKVDPSAIVYHGVKGYSYHCFRCSAHEFNGHGERTIAEINRHRAEFTAYNDSSRVNLELPTDFTLHIPARHRVWLFKSGITESEQVKFNIGWSPAHHRIVLPVYNDAQELICVQMRAVLEKQEPKYLNPKGPKVNGAVFYAECKDSDTFVVVEDILSAIKISRVANTFSILGTNMTFERAGYIASKTNAVKLWFDNDKAGHGANKKSADRLSMFDVHTSCVYSDADPKCYTTQEITEFLFAGRSDVQDA